MHSFLIKTTLCKWAKWIRIFQVPLLSIFSPQHSRVIHCTPSVPCIGYNTVCIPFLVLHLLTAPIPDTGTYSQSTHFQSFTCFQRISILPSKHSTETNWCCYSAFLHEAFFTCLLDKHYSNTVNLECSVWDCPWPQIQLWILNSSAKVWIPNLRAQNIRNMSGHLQKCPCTIRMWDDVSQKGQENWHSENSPFMKESVLLAVFTVVLSTWQQTTAQRITKTFTKQCQCILRAHSPVCQAKHKLTEKQHANAWLAFKQWEKARTTLKVLGFLMITLLQCTFTCKISRCFNQFLSALPDPPCGTSTISES